MTKEQKEFIETIAKYVRQYAGSYSILVHSPIIAQAILESGWGKSKLAKYHNYFGMKAGSAYTGKVVTFETKEQKKDGTYYTVTSKFRSYDSMEKGVKGYFDFISTARYYNLKNVTNPETYLKNIKSDGYATSLKYVENLMRVINTYDLTKYDTATVKYFKKYTGSGNSIVNALNSLNENSAFMSRTKIWDKNFTSKYKGTAEQNLKMLDLLKKGKLVKP